MYKPEYKEKLIRIFILLDDFCKDFSAWPQIIQVGEARIKLDRLPLLAESEMLTILIYYHYSGYKCFTYYY